MYTVNDLVRIAKREKNNQRSYLFVNPLQGKHIPVDPTKVERLCAELSHVIDNDYKNKRKYVIGFAETATGVTAAVCKGMSNVISYEHTTREYNSKNEYIYFTESHSHAKEQLLDIDGVEGVVRTSELIILVDDEITTGNTVCKLITQIREKFEYKGLFIIASFVNSMTEERISDLKRDGIECRYVLKIPHEYKTELAEQVSERENSDKKYDLYRERYSYNTIVLKNNPRKAVIWPEYLADMDFATEYIIGDCNIKDYDNVCIIGSEEFMFLTIHLGAHLVDNRLVKEVKIHSTTRSPIVPSSQDDYPLNVRYKLKSLYSEKRKTYIYNLSKYDKVIIVTDGTCDGKGLKSLISAVKDAGNADVSVYRCKYEK